MQVEQIKDLLQHMQQARYIIDGYCRRHNKIVLPLDILCVILYYYHDQIVMDDISTHLSTHSRSVASYVAAFIEDSEPWELIHDTTIRKQLHYDQFTNSNNKYPSTINQIECTRNPT
eukprot:233758_1